MSVDLNSVLDKIVDKIKFVGDKTVFELLATSDAQSMTDGTRIGFGSKRSSDYDFFIIEFIPDATSAATFYSIVPSNTNSYLLAEYNIRINGSKLMFGSRPTKPYSNGIEFGSCITKTVDSTTYVVPTSYILPRKIYGVKIG